MFTHFHLHYVALFALLNVEGKPVAHVCFGLVGYLQTLGRLLLEALFGQEVQDVLYVLDAVDMPVDVGIAVVGVDGAHQLGCFEAEASVTLDGTDVLLICYHIVENIPII